MLFGMAQSAQAESLRIVSLNPALTDLALELGLGDFMVGVSDYCDQERTHGAKRLGSELTPDLEGILAINASHVLRGTSLKRVELRLKKTTKDISLAMLTTEDLKAAIQALGAIFSRHEEATVLLDKLQEAMKRTSSFEERTLMVAGLSQHETPQFFLMNPDSLHGDLIQAAGFPLIESPKDNRAWMVGPESLLRLRPSLMLVLDPSAHRPDVQQRYKRALKPFTSTKTPLTVIWLSDPQLSSMGPNAFTLGEKTREAYRRDNGLKVQF